MREPLCDFVVEIISSELTSCLAAITGGHSLARYRADGSDGELRSSLRRKRRIYVDRAGMKIPARFTLLKAKRPSARTLSLPFRPHDPGGGDAATCQAACFSGGVGSPEQSREIARETLPRVVDKTFAPGRKPAFCSMRNVPASSGIAAAQIL